MRRAAALSLALLATVPARAQDAPPPNPGETPLKDAPKRRNRLAHESSPYLLQHAGNPVDWHPWGDAAFARATAEDKPVFLSIGYSTCHWCHVMERESFEDEAVARFLNERFVSIKVDREERPDVDAVYMAAVQATTGSGGWPLSAFLLHDRRPFFGGTYFPPEDRFGRPGFLTLLRRLDELWRTRRKDLEDGAAQIVDAIRRGESRAPGDLAAEPLADAVAQFRGTFDAARGGFGPAPKFPRAFALSFLLAQTARDPSADAVAMVERTLDAMSRGGIHDHLGGGFHRYSTDADWLVPHFEKMLYDQATLLRAYTDAWLVTGDARSRETARGIVAYVLRDLRDPAGGFHSAEDADSEGVEGKFYVWTEEELRTVLGAEDGALACRVWATSPDGNFRDEAHGTMSGANILHLRSPLAPHAKTLGIAEPALADRVEAMRAKLLAVRSQRVRPHLDDKVLADWNGLMIGALARAGAAFGEERWIAEASRAAEFVWTSMRTKDGALLHRWRKGDAAIPAFLEDHVFLALGLADLYEATFDPRWLAAARDLLAAALREFGDEDGTFRLAPRSGEALIAVSRELYDGALPSGNSAAALALLRVGAMTGDEALAKAGRRCVEAWMGTIARYPMGFPVACEALAWAVGATREVVIAGDPADPATRALVAETRKRLLPGTVVLLHAPGDAGRALARVAPFVAAQGPVDGKPAAYVCRDHACRAPVTSAAELGRLLDAR